MAEYIKREALIKESTFMFDYALGHCKCVLVEDILNTPAADVVEVVRCKDCKFALPHRNYYYCENEDSPFTNSDWAVCTNGDDFCSYGERKEGE